jgi:hypothetical protein
MPLILGCVRTGVKGQAKAVARTLVHCVCPHVKAPFRRSSARFTTSQACVRHYARVTGYTEVGGHPDLSFRVADNPRSEAHIKAADLVLVPDGIAAEPACRGHSWCVQMTVKHSPKRLSDFPKLDLFTIGQELCR